MCFACIAGLTPNVTNSYSSCVCPDRQYYSAGSLSCLPCPYDCLTCNNNGDCLTCSTQDHRQLNTTNSRCVPLPGYYDNGVTLADNCLTNCENCTSASTCTGCLARFVLAPSGPPSCQACPFDCYRCNSNGDCLSCGMADHRELRGNRCVPMAGFY
jgi:proprotein convertase subtilisin/kexin type 5